MNATDLLGLRVWKVELCPSVNGPLHLKISFGRDRQVTPAAVVTINATTIFDLEGAHLNLDEVEPGTPLP